jgi:hypothetical protein
MNRCFLEAIENIHNVGSSDKKHARALIFGWRTGDRRGPRCRSPESPAPAQGSVRPYARRASYSRGHFATHSRRSGCTISRPNQESIMPRPVARTPMRSERMTADVKTQVSCGRHNLLFSDAIVISNWYRSKQSFCVNGTLIRCLAIPLYGLTVVLIDANTVVEHPT